MVARLLAPGAGYILVVRRTRTLFAKRLLLAGGPRSYMARKSVEVDTYRDRPLVDGYPGLESIATDLKSSARPDDKREHLERVLSYVDRLIGIERVGRIAVVGCGPRPETISMLASLGYDVVGIEPVEEYVVAANAFLGGLARVEQGSAEDMQLEAESQDVILLESVLEHVDSPLNSLRETFRALAPGGLAVVITTNRLKLSLAGTNPEFNVRYYNWLPASVKEGYVHNHLHYGPQLANFSPRPAVHWFTFTRLCELGRTAGFARFYSHVDLMRPDDPSLSGVKRGLLRLIRVSPWMRALALSQVGRLVFMWKRGDG
jgi:2-polyprenyl-3-methyl-5-hydroxy-6-metoxy-1,4-benzoquinol methylase